MTAFMGAWFVAQMTKVVLYVLKNKGKLKVNILALAVKSGSMPSAHSASFMAMTTAIGLLEGFCSTGFAIALGLSMVIIYDAVNVRYAVGEQGKVLAEMNRKGGFVRKLPRLVEGHTVPEVIVGSWLGIVVGLLVFIVQNKFF